MDTKKDKKQKGKKQQITCKSEQNQYCNIPTYNNLVPRVFSLAWG